MLPTSRETISPADPSRLRSRTFYGIILAAVAVGAVICAAGGWTYLESNAQRPTGRRIWDGAAEQFVLPICVMIGATFGGLAGLTTAILIDSRGRRRERGAQRNPCEERADDR
jgi:hypothetical protein